MKDYYKILELKPSASSEDIRKAYRELARTYHPDVNPGAEATERFKEISEAYRTLKNPRKRKKYDAKLEVSKSKTGDSRINAYRKQQQAKRDSATEKYYKAQKQDLEALKKLKEQQDKRKSEREASNNFPAIIDKLKSTFAKLKKPLEAYRKSAAAKTKNSSGTAKPPARTSRVSIIEVSVTVAEAIKGIKKSVEIEDEGARRSISVSIPPGVHPGSVVRMRSKQSPGEEMVIVVRITKHPFLRLEQRGLVFEVPITVAEAVRGASIQIPTLDEPTVIKVPENCQSGQELKLKGQGVSDGQTTGDLFIRFMIKVPESNLAVGLKDKSEEIEAYYGAKVRNELPDNLK